MTIAVNSILDLVDARLKLISTVNGYNTTVKKVDRARMTPWKGYDLPAINYWSTGVSNVRNSYGGDERSISLFVEYHDKTNDDPFVDVAGGLAADVVTALNRAVLAPKVSDVLSLCLGGAVSDVIFDGYDYEIGEGQAPFCGVLVKFTIKYNTSTNNMVSFSS